MFLCFSANKEMSFLHSLFGPDGLCRLPRRAWAGRSGCTCRGSGQCILPVYPAGLRATFPSRTSSAPSVGMSSLCRASWLPTWSSTARSWPGAGRSPARPAARSLRRHCSSKSTRRLITKSGVSPAHCPLPWLGGNAVVDGGQIDRWIVAASGAPAQLLILGCLLQVSVTCSGRKISES